MVREAVAAARSFQVRIRLFFSILLIFFNHFSVFSAFLASNSPAVRSSSSPPSSSTPSTGPLSSSPSPASAPPFACWRSTSAGRAEASLRPSRPSAPLNQEAELAALKTAALERRSNSTLTMMRMKTIHGRAVLGRWAGLAEAVAQTTGNGITEVLEE